MLGSPKLSTGMVRVRRERRLVHSGCNSHPGTGSFRPVVIGAAVEVTKLLKPPVEEGRKGDSASVQAVRGLKATREAPAVIAVGSTGSSRETGRAVWGGGEACSTDEAG